MPQKERDCAVMAFVGKNLHLLARVWTTLLDSVEGFLHKKTPVVPSVEVSTSQMVRDNKSIGNRVHAVPDVVDFAPVGKLGCMLDLGANHGIKASVAVLRLVRPLVGMVFAVPCRLNPTTALELANPH